MNAVLAVPSGPILSAHPLSTRPLVYDRVEAAEIMFVSRKLQGLPHGRLLQIMQDLHKSLDDGDFARTAAFLASNLCIARHQVELRIHMNRELDQQFQCYIITRDHIGRKAVLLAHFFHLHLRETAQGFDIGVPNWTLGTVDYISSY
ncbi:hypothetical protein EB052_00235 [bacterium]|nr:hypothetical protein [bacterium]